MRAARSATFVACFGIGVVLASFAAAQRDERPEPVLIQLQEEPPATQRPAPPLAPEQMARLFETRRWREMGKLDRALATLQPLIADAPHHPLVLAERARLHLAKGEHAAIDRLARAERAAQKDSVLLAHEWSQALELLGRTREAAQVAIEAWAAEPREGPWAGSTVVRLLSTNTGAIRDLMRRAATRLPDRLDVAQGLARVEWRLGDVRAALRAISIADVPGGRPLVRWSLAEEMTRAGSERDSMAATEMLLDLAGDSRHETVVRFASARRAWEIFERRAAEAEGAQRMTHALADVRNAEWPPDLLISVARGLQKGGKPAEARALLETRVNGGPSEPKIALERVLADLREGPAERALPGLRELAGTSSDATFRYAEALFFAGQVDSALAWYKRSSEDARAPEAGAALERVFLIEEASPPQAAVAFGEIYYHRWRGETRAALTLADSLHRALGPGPTWAQATLLLSELREVTGDRQSALEPVLALVEALPEDRLASRARQRAGDLYLALGEETQAAEQYEECLARYPRAWNAPEVRRKLETLKRERRF